MKIKEGSPQRTFLNLERASEEASMRGIRVLGLDHKLVAVERFERAEVSTDVADLRTKIAVEPAGVRVGIGNRFCSFMRQRGSSAVDRRWIW